MSKVKERREQAEPWRSLTPERMRAAREALGLTQAQFALLIGRRLGHGIEPGWDKVQRWEAGGRKPGRIWGPCIESVVQEVERRQERVSQGQTAE
jgi:DNA-binding transcriptional regulator YiaG